MSKLSVKKVVEAMKSVAGVKKPELKIVVPEKPYRERNMMKEALDMGSHGANELFKDTEK